ncbi:MAG: hypothetical protein ABII72_01335 [Parcubacteria group bacterium]
MSPEEKGGRPWPMEFDVDDLSNYKMGEIIYVQVRLHDKASRGGNSQGEYALMRCTK